ncbi:hypothetical protein CR513_24783, partial [Mucuna pruriens]
MVTMFIDILPSPYYDKVVGNVASNFADLVVLGERIELGIRRGKFAQANNSTGFAKKPIFEKKKGETNVVLVKPIFLQEKKLVEIIPLKLLEPPYPKTYDPNARCDYHGRAVGHATERCWRMKHKVEDLLDGGLFGFQDMGPNVQSNPLLAHKGVAINVISHKNREEVERPNSKEWEKSTPRCITDSTDRMEEESHLRLDKA